MLCSEPVDLLLLPGGRLLDELGNGFGLRDVDRMAARHPDDGRAPVGDRHFMTPVHSHRA